MLPLNPIQCPLHLWKSEDGTFEFFSIICQSFLHLLEHMEYSLYNYFNVLSTNSVICAISGSVSND